MKNETNEGQDVTPEEETVDTSTEPTEDTKEDNVTQDPIEDDKSVPYHRFKEVNEQLQALKKADAERTKKELERDGKKDELIETLKGENQALTERLVNKAKTDAVIAEARRAGVREDAISDVVTLVGLDSIETDANGNPLNVDHIISTIVSTREYLVAPQKKPNMGSPTATAPTNVSARMWKQSEILQKSQNYSWYAENKDEINKAYNEGRVLLNE